MHPFLINYTVFSAIVILLLLLKRLRFRHEAMDVLFIIVSFFVLCLLHVGVDINSVEDLPNYNDLFQKISTSSFSSFNQEMEKPDFIYGLINKIVSLFSNEFVVFLLVYNLLFFFSFYNCFYKYSPYVPVSIVLLLLFGYNQSLFVLRQYMAISIILFTIPCIFNRKLVIYLILCFIALFVHSSSLIWLPVYFLYNTKNTKSFILRIAIASIVYAIVCSFIIQYMSAFHLEFSSYVDQAAKTSPTTIAIHFVYLFFYVFFLRKHIFDEGINRLCLITLYMVLIGYLFAPPITEMSRILQYFLSLSTIAIPITMSYIKNAVIKGVYLISILLIEGELVMRGLKEFYFASYRYDGVPLGIMIIIAIASLFAAVIYIKYVNKKKNIITNR